MNPYMHNYNTLVVLLGRAHFFKIAVNPYRWVSSPSEAVSVGGQLLAEQ